MTNVGTIIPTPSGLRTVVQVLPGQIDQSLSQAVTLPVGDAGSSFPPPEYFGTLLPGQAQSAASFVQTLVMPSGDAAPDTAPSSSSAPLTASTTPSETPITESANASTPASTSGETSSVSPPSSSQSHTGNAGTSPVAPAYSQAAGAYQTTQQRGSGQSAQHPLTIG